MIPTHIIQVIGYGVADAVDLCAPFSDQKVITKFPLWKVETDMDDRFISGKTGPSYDEAVAKWNSTFSKAPIQYTDKGKVCD